MARCLIDLVDNCYSKNAMAALESGLPKSLNRIYERLLENIDEKERTRIPTGIAQRVLRWLVGARRPLHILELYEAIMIEPGSNQLNEDFRMMDPADLLLACGSLIQSFSNSDLSIPNKLVEDLLEGDNFKLDTYSLTEDVLRKYQTIYVCLSHYTVKVC